MPIANQLLIHPCAKHTTPTQRLTHGAEIYQSQLQFEYQSLPHNRHIPHENAEAHALCSKCEQRFQEND